MKIPDNEFEKMLYTKTQKMPAPIGTRTRIAALITVLEGGKTKHSVSRDSDRLSLQGTFAGCLTSQQHTSVSQGRICSDSVTCCHNEIAVADQTISLSLSILTPRQPVLSLTLQRQVPGRAATEVPILSRWYDSTRKNPHDASGNRTSKVRSRSGRLKH